MKLADFGRTRVEEVDVLSEIERRRSVRHVGFEL